jgi:hypothetical protein
MKDELHQKIIEGLSRPLDGNLFEECAVDLLQPIYKTLVPIKGGRDDGRDGFFYDGAVGSGPLVCTTREDVKENVQHSLREFVKKGHKGRSVIIATSRSLTGEKRNAIEDAAKEEGFTTIQVHDQSDFALRLYRNKEWLKRLLNIVGNQQALSINPISSRPCFNIPVRGREELMNWLDESIVSGDVIITGQPGSGKTFAMRSYATQKDGLFVVSDNMDQIVPEVRDKQPRFLIVDDAHDQIALLKRLRQTREDTGAELLIIATSWLSHKNDVQSALSVPATSVFELKLLGKDTMVEIIKDCGVKGPDPLLQEMVDQAEGKPGLAATLSQLVLSGDAKDVYYGDALGRHLSTLFERQLGGDALDLLAVTALGGDSGICLKAAADILNKSRFHVQGLATNLAFGGAILEIPPDRICVRPPPLRPYLVKQHFFGKGVNIDPYGYLPRYPKQSDVVSVILSVALTGGKVDRERLYHLIEETRSPDLFGGYARLGRGEAGRVIGEHPDMALRSARALLDTYPEGILPLMLNLAIGDTRPLHSNPEHPMRMIQDWCKTVGYDNTIPIGNRDMLLEVLSSWRGRVQQDKVTAQVLVAIFCPRSEFFRPDPGSGHRFTLGTGHLSAKPLQHLIDLLPSAKEYFMVQGTDGLKELLGLLHDWVYEMPMMGETITIEQHALLHQGSSILLDYVNEAATGHPGIQARLEQYAHELRREIAYEKDVEYETIFPREDDRQTQQKAAGQQKEAALLLADSYSKLDPAEVIAKLSRYSKEAYDTGSTWPDYSSDMASYLANHVSNVGEWARLSVTEWDKPGFSYPLLARYYAVNPTEAEDLLMEALDHPSHSSAATQVIIKRPYVKDALWDKVYPVLKGMAMWIYGNVARQEVDEETILMLLEHPSDGIAMMVAAALEQLYDGKIPVLYVDRWETALVRFRPTSSSHDSFFSEALRKHPATIVKWLKARAAENTERYEEGFAQNAKELIPELSEDQKADLIGALQDTNCSKLVATHLVGDDPRLFECLLANSNAAVYQLDALSSVAGSVWRSFAEIAVRTGFGDTTIESASIRLEDSWSGPASEHSLELKKGYRDGLDSSEPRVVAIAQKCMDFYQKMSDGELAKEEDEDIYGY